MKDPRLDDIYYKAIKQHVRSQARDSINFGLQSARIYKSDVGVADFLSPAIKNLGLIGGGLGAAKGLMEPGVDELGNPIGMNQRLGNVALNTVLGAGAGAGLGVGYKAFRPGVQTAANKAADVIAEAPRAIDGYQAPRNFLDTVQDIARKDLTGAPRSPGALKNTANAVADRIGRDVDKTKRFFTGKGAGFDNIVEQVGDSRAIYDPVTKTTTQQFIPAMDKAGNPVTRVRQVFNPNHTYSTVSDADKIASSIAGGAAGAVSGVPLGLAGTGVGAAVGGGLGGLIGGAATIGAMGAGALPGAALGAKIGAGVGGTVGTIAPAIVGGVTGARNGLKGSIGIVKDRAVQDIDKLKAAGSGVVDAGKKVGGVLSEGAQRTRDFLGFEYPLRPIVTFGASNIGGHYKTAALVGGGLGAGTLGVAAVADTLNRQRLRDEQERDNIIDIDNPYVRMGEYQQYTSPEQSTMRNIRNGIDVAGRAALGVGVGTGLGVGIGGLVGHRMDIANSQKTPGLLSRLNSYRK